ncbi:hypothetical protein V8D89_010647 [Ganoderma adspersum]
MFLRNSTRSSRALARRVTRSHTSTRAQTRRPLSSQPQPPQPSPHARFYTDYAAGMIPVALLGSAVYIGLRTWQQHLAQERFLEEAYTHVRQLEAEVIALRQNLQSETSPDAQSPGQNMPNGEKKWSGWLPW